MPFIGSPFAFSGSLYTSIVKLGLTSGLQLCLDAGDAESYDGSSQKWLDRSGGGYDFFRGTDGTSQSSDPTFNGSAGQTDAYFSGDGADYFTYDTAIETWMQNLGKSGNSVTVFGHVRIASDTDTPIIATRGNAVGEYGMEVQYSAANNKLLYRYVDNASSLAGLGGVGPTITPAANVAFGFAVTLTSGQPYTVHVDGTNYNGTNGGTTVSNNPTGTLSILALGDASTIAPSGTRIYDLAVWSSKLTDADLTALQLDTVRKVGF